MSESGYRHNVDRFYSYDAWTFTKRELRPNERFLNAKGESIKAPWSTERLQNEFRALEFITSRTTIPVPKVIRFERIWGACQLVMERINGTPLNHIKNNKAQALLNAERFINTAVLPQLRSLTSSTSGALIGVVIPPNRLAARDQRKCWPVKTTSAPIFNFCHNDLGQHNILMNSLTLKVEAIIDWEFSGFYLPEFEAPLWMKSFDEPGYHDIDADKVESLIHFLADTGR